MSTQLSLHTTQTDGTLFLSSFSPCLSRCLSLSFLHGPYLDLLCARRGKGDGSTGGYYQSLEMSR